MDRVFVATNYEEVDLENNDDNSLCRYELMEIIVRLAKIKYLEKAKCDSFAEATRRIIVDSILPNQRNHMLLQEWREQRLWNLECDDLLKVNRAAIDQLYAEAKGRYTKNSSALVLKDAVELLKLAGYTGPENEKFGTIAYALSKMTIIDEMEHFGKYETMLPVEFLEFLGRVAELIFQGDQPLV